MGLSKKWKLSVVTALSVIMLMSSMSAFAAAEPQSVKETAGQAQFKIQDQSVGYVNPLNGSIYYNVSGEQGDEYWRGIVERTKEGKLLRWEDGVREIRGDERTAPILWIESEKRMNISTAWMSYLDVKNETVHEGINYNYSPDGAWSYVDQASYTPKHSMVHSYWFKNTETGDVEERFSSSATIHIEWMSDSRLLMSRYSEKAQQNEIVIYTPATNKFEFLMYGTLRGYSSSHHTMWYVNNEPSRQDKVYDFRTKRSRPISDPKERELFYSQTWKEYEKLPKLDAQLDVMNLPVKSIEIISDRLHKVQINGKNVEVPCVLKKDGTLWIPVMPLADALYWTIQGKDLSASNYRYGIKTDTHRVELTPSNSLIIDQHLFMTQGQLKSLGYDNVTITSNR